MKKADTQILCGDCLDVLPTLPPARMIFADPPDNLGVPYDGFEDKWATAEAYIAWLSDVTFAALLTGDIFWLSYYWRWDFDLKGRLSRVGVGEGWEVKPFIWRFTFGQHQQKDCGSGFRPILRFSQPDVKWGTDDIRILSARQTKYHDKRADPRGRVPDDAWTFPRVCGTFKEKRKWGKNQHPEALIKRMVLMSTKPGDLVIDMFGGTFTVARVCKALERRSISIEISKAYCEKGREELFRVRCRSPTRADRDATTT